MDIQDINVGDEVILTTAAAMLYPRFSCIALVVVSVDRRLDVITLQIEPVGTSNTITLSISSRYLLPAARTIKYGPPPPTTTTVPVQPTFPSANAPSILTPIPSAQPIFKVGDIVQYKDLKKFPQYSGQMIVLQVSVYSTRPDNQYCYNCYHPIAGTKVAYEYDLELSPNGIQSGATLLSYNSITPHSTLTSLTGPPVTTLSNTKSVDRGNSNFVTKPDEVKCECGSESIGYTTHSSWCGKFSK